MTRVENNSEHLDSWQPLTSDQRVLRLKYWWGPGSANALAFARSDGTWAIVSPPVNMPRTVYDDIERRGPVTTLVSPNAFHHLGQREWRARFPAAVSYAPAGALERLAKKSPGIPYRSLEDSPDALAPATPFVPRGMRTPDVLFTLATSNGILWWLGDQFSNNSKHDQTFLLGVISRILAHGLGFGLNPKPELVYVADRKAWLASIQEALAAHPPAMLVCGHGDPITTDAAQRAAKAVDRVARKVRIGPAT